MGFAQEARSAYITMRAIGQLAMERGDRELVNRIGDALGYRKCLQCGYSLYFKRPEMILMPRSEPHKMITAWTGFFRRNAVVSLIVTWDLTVLPICHDDFQRLPKAERLAFIQSQLRTKAQEIVALLAAQGARVGDKIISIEDVLSTWESGVNRTA